MGIMRPALNTLWNYRGPNPGHGDIQRVIHSDYDGVVTMTEVTTNWAQLPLWSWYGTAEEFEKVFTFIKQL
jgi:hypothetical protein